jgi:hypothetical protein
MRRVRVRERKSGALRGEEEEVREVGEGSREGGVRDLRGA